MQTLIFKDKKFNLPFIDLIHYSDDQNKALGQAIHQAGRILVPILAWKRDDGSIDVIDGAHRLLWAVKHGITQVPMVYEKFDSMEEAEERCREINLERRHLTMEQLSKAREERIARVMALREAGETLRDIATSEGVSTTQVRRDLGTNVTGEGARDISEAATPGKHRPKVLCKRCQRVGAVPRCDACKKARQRIERGKKTKAGKPTERIIGGDEESIKAEKLAQLPKSVATALHDTWHLSCAAELSKMRQQVKSICGWSVWLDPIELMAHLKGAEDILKAAAPRKACHVCKGQKKIDKTDCQRCRGSGFLANQKA